MNGSVGLTSTFGEFTGTAGFSPIHFESTTNLKKARRRSSFF
jgi:hypothetical protein